MSQGKSPIYRILVDGTIEPMPDKSPNWKDLQQAVGGYFEIVTLSPTHIMIVDEEGVIKNKPLNKEASILAGKRILGDVVILPSSYLD